MNKRKEVVIIDPDEAFLKRLSGLLADKAADSFNISSFTDKDLACSYMENRNIHILIAAEGMLDRRFNELNIHKIVKLTESENYTDEDEGVCRYGPVFRDIFMNLNEDNIFYGIEKNKDLCRRRHVNVEDKGKAVECTRIRGIFSFGEQGYKTAYALGLSEGLSMTKKVLYMNMEEFYSLGKSFEFNDTHSMSDLFYEYRMGRLKEAESYVESINGFYFISPCSCPDDIEEIKAEELESVLTMLSERLEIDEVILEMGGSYSKQVQVMDICGQIDILRGGEEGRINAFSSYLVRSGRSYLIDKFHQLDLDEDLRPFNGCLWGMEQRKSWIGWIAEKGLLL